MLLTALAAAALLAWLGVLALPSAPYRTRERIDGLDAEADADLDEVTALIPARNEAAAIGGTLGALARQGRGLAVIVIDDESTDGTREVAARAARGLGDRLRVEVVRGEPLPPGWGGKLWALQQGLERVDRQRVLLLDADIELGSGVLAALLAQARSTDAALVSVMAELRCRSFWERLLVPPFIFFFKLIYPFARVNDARRGTAAAAGGCMLLDAATLRAIGGFEPIRAELIDDCSLAASIKRSGRPIWLGLSHEVRSTRAYPRLASFAGMVSRTAFTQLKYSTVLLLLVTLAMLVVFAGPLAGAVPGAGSTTRVLAALAVLAMCLAYLPTVRYYRLVPLWTLTLPAAAMLFLGMTWVSAINYWRGIRANWKDRAYAAE